MNQVIITGAIGSELEIKEFQNSSVAKFSLAESRNVKKNNKWDKETVWHTIKLWNNDGLRQYLTKGSKILVSGVLDYNEWEDKDTKKKRKESFITALKIELLSVKTADGNSVNEDDIPF